MSRMVQRCCDEWGAWGATHSPQPPAPAPAMKVLGGSCLQGSAALGPCCPAERVHSEALSVSVGSEERAFHLSEGYLRSLVLLGAPLMPAKLH